MLPPLALRSGARASLSFCSWWNCVASQTTSYLYTQSCGGAHLNVAHEVNTRVLDLHGEVGVDALPKSRALELANCGYYL
jgi:hypothetical protein